MGVFITPNLYMPTNTLVNNICYPSTASAVDAFYSSMPVSVVTSSSNTFIVSFIKDTSNIWRQLKTVTSDTGVTTTTYSVPVTSPTFPQCDITEPFNDGMQMAWGIVSALIAVAGIILIRNALFR